MTHDPHDPLFTDTDLGTLNAAQTVLGMLSEVAKRRGSLVMTGERDYTSANALDYGQAAALAEHANDAIFNLLNLCNSHRIQSIPYRHLHNCEEPAEYGAPEPVA